MIKNNSAYKEMKNKYTREDEMASSCNEMLHCVDQLKRRCYRFTYKKHLRNRTELIALLTLALSLLHYQNKSFVEGMQIISHDYMSEFATTHIPQLYMDTHISEETPKLPTLIPDNNDNEIQFVRESNKDVQYLLKVDSENNDFELSTERNAEITDLSVLASGTTSSENLELSIRNSEKSQLETDKHLKFTPVLEMFKMSEVDNFEKIIKENVYSKKAFYQPDFAMEENDEHLELHADGEQSTETISKIYDINKRNYIEDQFYSFQPLSMENNKTDYQVEASTNIFDQKKVNNNFAIVKKIVSANFEDSFNEVNETKKLDKNNDDSTKSYYNNTLRSLSQTPTKIEDIEIVENTAKEEKENVTKDETKEFHTQIKHFNKLNSRLTNIIAVSQPLLTFDSSDIVTQNYDNKYNDNILSVDLNETISTVSNNVQETNLSLEEYSKSYLGEITGESENSNNTSIDEELEHVVIKKVLDAQELFDDPFATTNHEHDVENRNSDSMSPCRDHTSNIKTLNDSIKPDELMAEYITVSTGIEENDENISTTDVEYHQSTEAIEQYESNYYFNKPIQETFVDVPHAGSEVENVLVIRDSDKKPEQKVTLNSSENFKNETEENTDNAKIEVGDSLWTTDKDIPPKKEITVIYYKENITAIGIAESDKYIQPMMTTEESESNTNLIQNIQNEHLTDITDMNMDINEQDINQEITLKNSENIQQESERFDENNSIIVIPDINKYTKVTEKYESNYISTTFENEKIEASELGKMAKGSRSLGKQVITLPFDDKAAFFEAYPPRDVGQTFNDNLADESAGIGKALPVSVANGSNRSTIIIILSCGTAILFILISVTIFLISFQRQHGTLDIEMHERNCGKDDLDEEDAQTFAKLLEVELSPSIAVTLEESEECL